MTVDLTCPYCSFSRRMSQEKIPANAKWATCPRCHQRFEIHPPDHGAESETKETVTGSQYQGEEDAEKVMLQKGAPWENRSALGLWQGIYQTIKQVLFSPDTLFRTLTFKGGFSEPLAFGLLVGSFGRMLGFFWLFLLMSGGLPSLSEFLFGQLTVGLIFLRMMIFIPLFVIMRMFVFSAAWHLFLLIVRGANNGYEATFRVISYSQAVQAWAVIPFIGGLISSVWQLIVQIVGLREIHKTTYLKVILAFLIPVGVIFLLVIATVILVFMVIGRHQFGQLWS